MTNNKQPLPIGVDDFKEIRDNNYCYVDKTPLISEILGGRSKVILFTRPRRFGKTLNLSMMQHFLDCDAPNSLPLFKGLKIEKEENGRFLKYMNKYPVFFITLKTLDFNNFESFLKKLNLILSRQFEKYRYLLQSKKLSQDQKDFFQRIVSKNANKEDLQSSLQFICDVLALHHEQKTFLLIDEYDAPIHSAFNNKKYNECIEFMRGFYSDALKTNINLNKAVMTGILRVAKESIFSGLNNLDVLTVTSPNCAHYFGLTEIEIKQLLVNFELEQEFENVKKWYNGYQFGLNSSLYNPWSIINWLKNSAHQFISYWVNTSSNDLIRSLFFEHSNILEESIEKLLCSESIQIELQENLHFPTLQTKCSENDYFTLLLTPVLD